jgi:CRISPR system Cascade subunit CasE
MYLSRIDLNIRSQQARAEMADPYQMHRTLSKAFGDEIEDYKAARVLFRVDTPKDAAEYCVIVQSLVKPQWERLTLSGDYLLAPIKLKPFDPQPEAGRTLAFRLRANPTVKRDGKRWGLENGDDQVRWLERKGKASGFQVLSVSVRSNGKLGSKNVLGDNGRLFGVIFEGILQVTDADAFRSTLENGIGSAKGFGFGLLSVAPIRR